MSEGLQTWADCPNKSEPSVITGHRTCRLAKYSRRFTWCCEINLDEKQCPKGYVR